MRDLVPFSHRRLSLSRSVFDEVDRLFNEAFGKDFFPKALSRSSYPKMNVYDNDGKLNIDVYVPEVNKENLNIDIKEDVLTVSGKSDKNKEVSGERYYCKEVSGRAFSRSVRIPENVTLKDIKAEHKDGMLKIAIPYKEEEKAEEVQKVTIQ